MKVPITPPDFRNFVTPDLINKMTKMNLLHFEPQDGYLHWDKIRHLDIPKGFTPEEYWSVIKMRRLAQSRSIPLVSKNSEQFHFVQTDFISRKLHWLDQYTGGIIEGPQVFESSSNKRKFLVSSIIEEAFRSSQLEGASTTRHKAKEMILKKEEPQNISERMVFNNYNAMEYIKEIKDNELTPALIFSLHRIITADTLEDNRYEGVIRDNDDIHVTDRMSGRTLHVPPAHGYLHERMEALCDFANNEQETVFVHPVIKAIILHFMIGYDHPFVDGNGRTARALFYWYCLKHKYWLMEYLSISKIIREAPDQYSRAYLYTETDGNDLTYFIHHQLDVILKATNQMIDYMKAKSEQAGALEEILKGKKIAHLFNSRQLALLRHMFQHPGYSYTIYEHQSYHNVSFQTARNDLFKLSDDLKLMRRLRPDGKTYIFIPYNDLNTRLEKLK